MKRFSYFITTVLFTLLLSMQALASSAAITFSDPSVTVGSDVNVTMKVSSGETTLARADVTLAYDANLLDSESCFTIQHTSDGYLIANVFGMANIFETEQWTAISSFGSFVTYDEPSDSYICQSGDNYLSYNRLTREELIEQGKELVKDYQLTEKEKEEYGIN